MLAFGGSVSALTSDAGMSQSQQQLNYLVSGGSLPAKFHFGAVRELSMSGDPNVSA